MYMVTKHVESEKRECHYVSLNSKGNLSNSGRYTVTLTVTESDSHALPFGAPQPEAQPQHYSVPRTNAESAFKSA